MNKLLTALTLAFVLLISGGCGDHSHHDMVDNRGDAAMGFSHEKTTHHFRLYADGGAIEVTANDPSDKTSTDQIRMHLTHISQKFAAGDFEAPMLTHGKVPPGVPVLQKLKADVKYVYAELPQGAAVRITTSNPEALAAVHEFMKFQIEDHRTGDTTEIR